MAAWPHGYDAGKKVNGRKRPIDRLCNFAPQDAHHLNKVILRELEAIRDDRERLRNFFHASDLPLPRTLLF